MSDERQISYTTAEVAKHLGCSRATVRLYIKVGWLKAYRTGRVLHVHYKELERFGEHGRKFGFPSVWDKNRPWPAQRQQQREQKQA